MDHLLFTAAHADPDCFPSLPQIQAIFIFQDIEMYYQELDTPCVPKTWNSMSSPLAFELCSQNRWPHLTLSIFFRVDSLGRVRSFASISE